MTYVNNASGLISIGFFIALAFADEGRRCDAQGLGGGADIAFLFISQRQIMVFQLFQRFV